MDIFVEPVLPLPELVVFGEGPVALALAQISGWFGFTLTLCSKMKPVELKFDCYFPRQMNLPIVLIKVLIATLS